MGPHTTDLTRRRLLALASALTVMSSTAFAASSKNPSVKVLLDDALARYGFPHGHPLGIDRQAAFVREADAQGLLRNVERASSRIATREELARFHTHDYIHEVASAESQGRELLDGGDTPVFPGVYAASSTVVGAALEGLAQVMSGPRIWEVPSMSPMESMSPSPVAIQANCVSQCRAQPIPRPSSNSALTSATLA